MASDQVAQDVTVNPALMVDSVLSGPAVLQSGLDIERDVKGPDDPINCGRLKNYVSWIV